MDRSSQDVVSASEHPLSPHEACALVAKEKRRMFGKPQWFRPKTIGWGLVPITWQGWLYTGGWGGAIALPFLTLVARHQPLEAMIWMALSIGALACDVWQILRAIRAPRRSPAAATAACHPKNDDNVLYILDSRPGQPVATRNYNLRT
jgi:hypothetical protein